MANQPRRPGHLGALGGGVQFGGHGEGGAQGDRGGQGQGKVRVIGVKEPLREQAVPKEGQEEVMSSQYIKKMLTLHLAEYSFITLT